MKHENRCETLRNRLSRILFRNFYKLALLPIPRTATLPVNAMNDLLIALKPLFSMLAAIQQLSLQATIYQSLGALGTHRAAKKN